MRPTDRLRKTVPASMSGKRLSKAFSSFVQTDAVRPNIESFISLSASASDLTCGTDPSERISFGDQMRQTFATATTGPNVSSVIIFIE